MGEDGALVAYPDECYTCGSCVMDCPCSAITMRIPAPMRLAAVREPGRELRPKHCSRKGAIWVHDLTSSRSRQMF